MTRPRLWRWVFTCLLDDIQRNSQQAISALTTKEPIKSSSDCVSKYSDAKERCGTINEYAAYAKECIRVLQTVSTILQDDVQLLQLECAKLQTELLSRTMVLDMHRQLSRAETRAGDAAAEQSLQEGLIDLRSTVARTSKQHQLAMKRHQRVDAIIAATNNLKAEGLLAAQSAKGEMDRAMNEIMQEHARLGDFIAINGGGDVDSRKPKDANE